MQGNGFQRYDPQLIQKGKRLGFYLRLVQVGRVVGITAQDHRAAFFHGDLPKQGIGVVALFPQAQKVQFQGDITAFGSLAQLADMALVGTVRAGEMQDIRVGNIGKGSQDI